MHTWYVVFNVTKEPFDDARVRQAVAFAVDRQAIVDAILGGTGVLAKNFLPPVVWGYTDDVADYPYDPERAKELLAEAGYPDGFEVEFWVPESGSGMQQSVAMGTVIQDFLSRVGIRVTIQQFEWGTYLDRVIVPVENADAVPAMFEMSWIGDNGDPDNFLYILLSGDHFNNGFNLGYYSNEQVASSAPPAPASTKTSAWRFTRQKRSWPTCPSCPWTTRPRPGHAQLCRTRPGYSASKRSR